MGRAWRRQFFIAIHVVFQLQKFAFPLDQKINDNMDQRQYDLGKCFVTRTNAVDAEGAGANPADVAAVGADSAGA